MVLAAENLDSYYSCNGKNIILFRYQPAFGDFINFCYGQSAFIRNYRLHSQKLNRQSLQEELLKTQSMPPGTLKSIEWVICQKDSYRPIGLAGLVNYQQQHRFAELLIGLPSNQTHQSFALEATLLVIEFAFKVAKLNKLLSLVYAYNKKAQQTTLKLGFQQEGLLRRHIKNAQGEFVDLYHNALFASDIVLEGKLSRLSKRCLGRDIAEEILKPAVNIFDDDPVQALLANR